MIHNLYQCSNKGVLIILDAFLSIRDKRCDLQLNHCVSHLFEITTKVLPTRWNRPFVLCPMCLGFRLCQKQRLSRLVLETAGADRQKESHYCSGEKDACALLQAADIRRVL